MRRRTLLSSAAVAATMGVAGCAGAGDRAEQETTTETLTTTTEGGGAQTTTAGGGGNAFAITSPEWDDGGTIPTKYTCAGDNTSPPLSISNPPEGTAAFALLMDDPDAPNPPFVHWTMWNVPADATEIPADVPNGETVDSLGGAVQGANGTGDLGYIGPCPPKGDPQHTYLFSLYALDSELDLDPGAEYPRVVDAVINNAIARARYVGQYERAAGTTTQS